MPDIYRHVTSIGLPWAVIATKWFICLFAEVLPTEVQNIYYYINEKYNNFITFILDNFKNLGLSFL